MRVLNEHFKELPFFFFLLSSFFFALSMIILLFFDTVDNWLCGNYFIYISIKPNENPNIFCSMTHNLSNRYKNNYYFIVSL